MSKTEIAAWMLPQSREVLGKEDTLHYIARQIDVPKDEAWLNEMVSEAYN